MEVLIIGQYVNHMMKVSLINGPVLVFMFI